MFEANFDRFLQTLPIMGKGMLSIFIVTTVIIICMHLFSYLTRNKDNN